MCNRRPEAVAARNLYADSAGFGVGNQLVIKGTPVAFTHSNRRIDPAPPAEFFEHGG
jgi:hypothetical protein